MKKLLIISLVLLSGCATKKNIKTDTERRDSVSVKVERVTETNASLTKDSLIEEVITVSEFVQVDSKPILNKQTKIKRTKKGSQQSNMIQKEATSVAIDSTHIDKDKTQVVKESKSTVGNEFLKILIPIPAILICLIALFLIFKKQ